MRVGADFGTVLALLSLDLFEDAGVPLEFVMLLDFSPPSIVGHLVYLLLVLEYSLYSIGWIPDIEKEVLVNHGWLTLTSRERPLA